MNVLVTGATGFLGTTLCRRLEKEGHSLVRLNSKICDLTRENSLLRFNDRKYDQVFHLAAWTQAGDFCLTHPGEQWLINQKMNTHVLAWWHAHQPQARLIAIGTSCSYAPELELAEENYMRGEPIESLYTYAMSKRMLYTGLMALNKQFGLNYLHVVPSTLYGPGYHTDGRQMHFIFDLIRKILKAKHQDVPPVLWGDGYQQRELVYLDDFVTILLRLIPIVNNDLVNIGYGEEHSIRWFARNICELVGYDPARVQYDTSRYVGAESKCLRNEKLKRLLPDLALTSHEVGLKNTIDWFEESGAWKK